MTEIIDQRAIIDRRTLAGRLAEIVADLDPQAAEIRTLVLTALKEALLTGRRELRRRLEAGDDGPSNTRARAFLIDQLLRAAYDFTIEHVFPATNPTKAERLAVIAVGGYGRGELAPHSDIDLMFLFPYKAPPWGEQVVEYLLYLLWDLGLKVGHSTRSIDDAIRLAKADMTICTALLEARPIYGEDALFEELRRRFVKEVQGASGSAFVEAKLKERDDRHQRMGDSRYVVEPNLKDGKGGLRDLHTLFWIAKFVYRVADPAQLVDKGVLSPTELRHFNQAHQFLWRVRCHLHELAGRGEERLTFDMQPRLAERLRYRSHAGSRGVERFMKHYFLIAKTVGDLTRIICAAIEDQNRKKPLFTLPRFRLGRTKLDGFIVEKGRLRLASDDAFSKEPVALLRLFHVAQKHSLDIHPNALREVRRNLLRIDAKLRAEPEANRLFMDMLTSERDPEITLRRLNEAGVFGRFVPDFGRVVAQMQHDMYHHYTVDEHTIRAIGILAEVERGDLREELPLASEIIHQVLSRRVLYLSVLLHDIAKGRGGDHSVLGAEVAMRLGPRFGLSDAETETVAWLVRWHLAMSNVAFKRDLDDGKTIADFAAQVQSPERLRLLLCLTVADIRAVGPGIWNGWKAQLLRELYWRAEESLSGGHATEGRRARVEAKRAALREKLGAWSEEERERMIARHAESYWLSTSSDVHQRHAEFMRKADVDGRNIGIDRRIDAFRSVTEILVYTDDHPGLFMRIAGAMAVSGASIVDAKIFTTQDGKALDTFFIQDATGGPYDRPDRLDRLVDAIQQTLSGKMVPHRVLADRKALPSRFDTFAVQPRVLIDNKISNTNTVIEVNGRDRAGLLYDLTRALYDLNLSITSAHIATFGERAVDTFYVRDVFGLKIEHEGKLVRIRERLMIALKGPGRSKGAEALAALSAE